METRDYVSLRKDTVSGCIDKNDVSCVFTEWWNGEGINFTFDSKVVDLHLNELHMVVVAAALLGMVDRDEVREDIRRLKESWNTFTKFRNDNSLTDNWSDHD